MPLLYLNCVHEKQVSRVIIQNQLKLSPCFTSVLLYLSLQERIAKAHGSQCGFCTPWFVMSMYTLLRNNPTPSEEEIEAAFEGKWQENNRKKLPVYKIPS